MARPSRLGQGAAHGGRGADGRAQDLWAGGAGRCKEQVGHAGEVPPVPGASYSNPRPVVAGGGVGGVGSAQDRLPSARDCGATRQRPPGLRLLLPFAFGASVCTRSVPTAGLASNSRLEAFLPLLSLSCLSVCSLGSQGQRSTMATSRQRVTTGTSRPTLQKSFASPSDHGRCGFLP